MNKEYFSDSCNKSVLVAADQKVIRIKGKVSFDYVRNIGVSTLNYESVRDGYYGARISRVEAEKISGSKVRLPFVELVKRAE
jgi:hypothetical protein